MEDAEIWVEIGLDNGDSIVVRVSSNNKARGASDFVMQ